MCGQGPGEMTESLPDYTELNRARRVLGLPEMATYEEIRSAYKKLALKYHPDRCEGKDKALCAQKMADINSAYRIIAGYVRNYRYFFTEKAFREQDTEYAVRRFFK